MRNFRPQHTGYYPYGDTKPYSITGYEASQRRLPVSTLKAGEAWHNGGGHRATVRHLVNDEAARSCACYILGSDMGLTYTGNYAKGVLSVEETTDEDGITEATYTDFRGRCVMKAHGPTRTYYVYNDYGDLCYILPPILSPRSYAAGDPDLAEYAYISRYDSRGRLIYSKKPGCGPEQFVYDNANRLVAETNADLGSKWRLHFYDSNGREVLVTEATLQPDAARRESLATPRSVARGSSPAAGLKGYTTDFDFPSDNRVRTAVYYDDYTLLPSRSAGTVPYLAAPAGLQTGLWAASDDNGPGVYRIFRYDSRGRKIHEVFETDRHRLSRSTAYTYTGKVAREVENVCEISSPTGKQWQLERRYGYDNAGCLTSETATFDSCTVLTRYIYDEAGRLSRTEKGPDRSGGNLSDQISLSSCTASRDYSYDVHGWPVKIVTKVRERIEPAHIDPPGISREYYNTASLGTGQILPGLFRTSTFTETIHYADGTNPRYNGTPSARGLTQGGRYDYSYDGLNRLSAAVYTAPESSPDADFSTEYTYDMLSRPLTIRRRGVVDIDGTTEIFGQLDDITLSYGGATLSRVQSNITDGTGREFYGRTGWANGTYMTGAVLKYNSAGRLIMDSSRMISLIAYNSIGLPVCYSRSPSTTDNAPRQERVYDATGRKLRQTDYQFIRGQVAPVADRRYVESFTFNTDTLERTDFSGGYFDGAGNAHFLFTDWQGNVTLAVSAGGSVEQHTGYYPYGEPWREPSGQHARLFAGKERVAGLPEGEYDFGPRGYRSTFLLWDSWDVKATDYPQWSPWLYCGANPINSIDPSGMKIIGMTKDDAAMVVEDFRAMFPGEEFTKFRDLIVQSGKKQNGKSLAPISQEALSEAFDGITLNEDQQALMEMVVNTINSKDKHKVEYIKSSDVLSREATEAFLPTFLEGEIAPYMPLIIKKNGGIPIQLISAEGGGGVTTHINNNSFSLIIKDGEHPNGRSVTTGHEILGHGRSWATGLGHDYQHAQAIRTENLILRVMGIKFTNTGINHGREKTPVPEPSLLPSFR